jgi:hypothetical protein
MRNQIIVAVVILSFVAGAAVVYGAKPSMSIEEADRYMKQSVEIGKHIYAAAWRRGTAEVYRDEPIDGTLARGTYMALRLSTETAPFAFAVDKLEEGVALGLRNMKAVADALAFYGFPSTTLTDNFVGDMDHDLNKVNARVSESVSELVAHLAPHSEEPSDNAIESYRAFYIPLYPKKTTFVRIANEFDTAGLNIDLALAVHGTEQVRPCAIQDEMAVAISPDEVKINMIDPAAHRLIGIASCFPTAKRSAWITLRLSNLNGQAQDVVDKAYEYLISGTGLTKGQLDAKISNIDQAIGGKFLLRKGAF